jgi:hypothetical protein
MWSAGADGFHRLVRLLNEQRRNRVVGLLSVPRALSAQEPDDLPEHAELLDRVLRCRRLRNGVWWHRATFAGCHTGKPKILQFWADRTPPELRL